MKSTLLVLFILIYSLSFSQNVGIGTNTPNSSAILDVASTSKGILLPRVADTSNIATPAEGLVIYSQTAKAPNYFDGNKWNNVADARNNFVPLVGTIKYIVSVATVGGIASDAGTLDAIDYGNSSVLPISQGGSGSSAGIPSGMDSVLISKEFDGNSIFFKRVHLGGSNIAVIEIQHFLPGATTPFYSVKLSNSKIGSQSFFISEKTGKLTERYTIVPTIVGYKDWVNGKSFSYNVSTRMFGSY